MSTAHTVFQDIIREQNQKAGGQLSGFACESRLIPRGDIIYK